jgi:predicted transcriptional regulator
MDIQLEKQELMKRLSETNDPSIIESIKKIFQKEKKDWWNELSENHKATIEQGEKDFENGDFVTSEEFFEMLKAR